MCFRSVDLTPFIFCGIQISRHIYRNVLYNLWNYTTYSSRKWMLVVCCLMKQNCYFLRGVAECRHAATPLSSYCINTTHQGFQKRYITLLYLKGLKSYQPSKFKCLHFTPLSLVNRTFHLHFCWYLLSPLRYNKVKYLFWKPWSVVLML